MSIKSIELHEGISLNAEAQVQVRLFFQLYEKVYLGGAITSSENIELILDPDDNRYLVGFRITVRDSSESTINESMEQAKRITDYLSFRTNTVVRHKRPRIRKTKNGMTENTFDFTVDTVTAKNIELDIKKTSSLFSSDSYKSTFSTLPRWLEVLTG